MVPRPLSNPPNPWLSTEVEYLDEIPPAELEVYEDHTREILSHNDSPSDGRGPDGHGLVERHSEDAFRVLEEIDVVRIESLLDYAADTLAGSRESGQPKSGRHQTEIQDADPDG